MQKILSIVILMLVTVNVNATDIIPKKSQYYYELGGGSNINLPPPSRNRTIKLGGYANSDLGYACTGFNPSISIGNSLNNVKDSSQALGTDMVSSLTVAVGSFPMYFLSKANPELYSIIQNAMASAEEIFKVSMKDCEVALSDIKKGKSVYEDWFSISDSQGWLDSFQAAKEGGAVDINNVVKNNTKNHRKSGIPWIHDQNSGGKNQKPINVLQDVVIAGYNVTAQEEGALKRPLDGNSAVAKDSVLYKFWKTPKEAGNYAKYVLGDITISSDKAKENENDTHAGMGLVGILKNCPFVNKAIIGEINFNNKTCTKEVRDSLITLIQSDDRPSLSQLQAISPGNMLITPDIIQNIRNMSDDYKAITISKISEDIAMQNVVEEALMLRRLLIAGSQTRPVQNLEPALNVIYKTIEYLDVELNNLSFESDMREKFSSHTISSIMNENTLNERNAIANQNTKKSSDMYSGAVYTKREKAL